MKVVAMLGILTVGWIIGISCEAHEMRTPAHFWLIGALAGTIAGAVGASR